MSNNSNNKTLGGRKLSSTSRVLPDGVILVDYVKDMIGTTSVCCLDTQQYYGLRSDPAVFSYHAYTSGKSEEYLRVISAVEAGKMRRMSAPLRRSVKSSTLRGESYFRISKIYIMDTEVVLRGQLILRKGFLKSIKERHVEAEFKWLFGVSVGLYGNPSATEVRSGQSNADFRSTYNFSIKANVGSLSQMEFRDTHLGTWITNFLFYAEKIGLYVLPAREIIVESTNCVLNHSMKLVAPNKSIVPKVVKTGFVVSPDRSSILFVPANNQEVSLAQRRSPSSSFDMWHSEYLKSVYTSLILKLYQEN